jgi:hypothetical protein
MSNHSSLPPIASPHGAPQNDALPFQPEQSPNESVSVSYGSMPSLQANARMTAKVMVSTPVCLLFELVALPILPFLFLAAFLVNFAVLKPRGSTTTILNRDGLRERAKFLSLSISWKRVLWVFDWGRDVCVVTIGGGCFIPREAFASREESHEFVQIARELKQSGGAAWRDEWNGRVFGAAVSFANNSSDER